MPNDSVPRLIRAFTKAFSLDHRSRKKTVTIPYRLLKIVAERLVQTRYCWLNNFGMSKQNNIDKYYK